MRVKLLLDILLDLTLSTFLTFFVIMDQHIAGLFAAVKEHIPNVIFQLLSIIAFAMTISAPFFKELIPILSDKWLFRRNQIATRVSIDAFLSGSAYHTDAALVREIKEKRDSHAFNEFYGISCSREKRKALLKLNAGAKQKLDWKDIKAAAPLLQLNEYHKLEVKHGASTWIERVCAAFVTGMVGGMYLISSAVLCSQFFMPTMMFFPHSLTSTFIIWSCMFIALVFVRICNERYFAADKIKKILKEIRNSKKIHKAIC